MDFIDNLNALFFIKNQDHKLCCPKKSKQTNIIHHLVLHYLYISILIKRVCILGECIG